MAIRENIVHRLCENNQTVFGSTESFPKQGRPRILQKTL